MSTGEPYIYGAANPITYGDPSGLDPCPGGGGGCGGVRQGDHNGDGFVCDGAGLSVCGDDEPLVPIGTGVDEVRRLRESRTFISQVMAAVRDMDVTGAGSCASGNAGFVVRGSASVCTFKVDGVDARIWALTLGGGVESNISAAATADTAITNAETEVDLAGRGRCFAVSGGEGVSVTGGVCGGVEGGEFNGIVVAYSGIGFGAGVLPVDASATETWTWVTVFEQMARKTYRNPDGSCTNGGSAGYCGQGSMNQGGVPGWPP